MLTTLGMQSLVAVAASCSASATSQSRAHAGCLLHLMLTGTQDAIGVDHLGDAGQTADLIEEADRRQHPQGSGSSGSGDGPDLRDLCSPAGDQFVGSHQTPPSDVVHGGRADGCQWHSALLNDPAPPMGQAHQLQKVAWQQLHHDKIAGAQHAHERHKSLHRGLQGRGSIQHGGYQSMHRQRSFDPSNVQKHFRGISLGDNTLEDPTMLADPATSHVSVSLLHLCQRTCVILYRRPAVIRCLFQVRFRFVHTAAKLLMLHCSVLQHRMVSGMCQPVQILTCPDSQQLSICLCRCKTPQLCLV